MIGTVSAGSICITLHTGADRDRRLGPVLMSDSRDAASRDDTDLDRFMSDMGH
jgi:hypothetical protein